MSLSRLIKVKKTATAATVAVPTIVSNVVTGFTGATTTTLTSILIPKTVTRIGRGVFRGCTKLKSIGYIGGYDATAAQMSIGDLAFYGCTSLTDVSLYAKRIEDYAFYNCTSLVRLGGGGLGSCEKFGSLAFYNCTKFTDDNFPKYDTSDVKIGFRVFTNTLVAARWAAELPVYFAAGATFEN